MRILYIDGKSNVPPDALSRHELDLGIVPNMPPIQASGSETLAFNSLQTTTPTASISLEQIKSLQEQDPLLKPLAKLARSRDDRFHFSADNVLYTKRNQLVIPSSLRD